MSFTLFQRTVLRHSPLIMTKPEEETTPPATGDSTAGEKENLASAARKSAGKGIWMGTAVGIGSAAIVAALLYANKKRS